MKHLFLGAAALALMACGAEDDAADTAAPSGAEEEASSSEPSATEEAAPSVEAQLDAVLAAQSDDAKARYQYRHPKETLMFFGVEPGMTVADTLPGDVWYAGILSEFLGPDGRVIGANYAIEHRMAMGGRYASEEWLQDYKNWPQSWVGEMEAERGEDEAPFSAFFYGSLPEDMHATADVVLMVRAAQHFNRLEGEGSYFTTALNDIKNVLKPGGVLGIVQHRAPEEHSDEWAMGGKGYVKQSHIISFVESAGFEFVDSSEVNANPNDTPAEEDVVWRLPPSLSTSREDPELRAQMQAIGESDRMTLKFRKP